MAQKRNEERQHQKAIALGQENLTLVPRIERWCEFIKVRQVSAGLLAEMTRLPIGMMAIDCPHAKGGGIQSMTLRDVAAYFATNNCRGCPQHRELNPDNVGREILREADKVVAEEKAEAARLSASASRLRAMVRGDLTVALKTAPTTEQSVLECVARLDDPNQAADAAKLLIQAAEIAPEFFNNLACEVPDCDRRNSRGFADHAQRGPRVIARRGRKGQAGLGRRGQAAEQLCRGGRQGRGGSVG